MQLLKNLADGQGVYALINAVWFFGLLSFLAYRACTPKQEK